MIGQLQSESGLRALTFDPGTGCDPGGWRSGRAHQLAGAVLEVLLQTLIGRRRARALLRALAHAPPGARRARLLVVHLRRVGSPRRGPNGLLLVHETHLLAAPTNRCIIHPQRTKWYSVRTDKNMNPIGSVGGRAGGQPNV